MHMNIHELMQNTELIKILNEIYITGRQTRAAPTTKSNVCHNP